MFEPFFEDFEVGQVIRHSVGRTITEVDNTWFTLLTLNTNQLHFNRQYAARSEFGRVLVNSGFSLGLVLGMSVLETSHHAIANLGFEEIHFPHPLFVGDTVWVESRVLRVRQSKSRSHAGIVRVRTRGLNQDGRVCVTFVRSFLVHRRNSPHAKEFFPEAETRIEEDDGESSKENRKEYR